MCQMSVKHFFSILNPHNHHSIGSSIVQATRYMETWMNNGCIWASNGGILHLMPEVLDNAFVGPKFCNNI